MNMNMCLSRVTVAPNVVQQQVVICDVLNRLVRRNERVFSVVRHQDNVKQLCVVIILSLSFEALVELVVQLMASTSSSYHLTTKCLHSSLHVHIALSGLRSTF